MVYIKGYSSIVDNKCENDVEKEHRDRPAEISGAGICLDLLLFISTDLARQNALELVDSFSSQVAHCV